MRLDEKVLEAFYDIITPSKVEMFDRIAADRTNHITVVLENTQKDHNASAVLRTCDCFGIQNLHAIEKNTNYTIQREIARGAGNWVDLHTYAEGENLTRNSLLQIKDQGYRLVAATPHTDMEFNRIPIDKPIALVFGTERQGISKEAMEIADATAKIPMYGFTESFNVSVSVALILNMLRDRLEKETFQWKLTQKEQVLQKIKWCTKIIREGEQVEKEIRKRFLEL